MSGTGMHSIPSTAGISGMADSQNNVNNGMNNDVISTDPM